MTVRQLFDDWRDVGIVPCGRRRDVLAWSMCGVFHCIITALRVYWRCASIGTVRAGASSARAMSERMLYAIRAGLKRRRIRTIDTVSWRKPAGQSARIASGPAEVSSVPTRIQKRFGAQLLPGTMDSVRTCWQTGQTVATYYVFAGPSE